MYSTFMDWGSLQEGGWVVTKWHQCCSGLIMEKRQTTITHPEINQSWSQQKPAQRSRKHRVPQSLSQEQSHNTDLSGEHFEQSGELISSLPDGREMLEHWYYTKNECGFMAIMQC